MTTSPTRWDDLLETSVVGSFTSLGYRIRSRHWDDISPNGLADRTVLVTGATSGIGKIVARELAGHGARLRVLARNKDKVETLLHDLEDETGNGDLRYYIADLSLMSEVDRISSEILDGEAQLHVLINNAVILPPRRIETAEGLELAHATNLVAPFLLTNRLRPLLVESAPARVINVISGGMYTQALKLDDLNSTEGEYRGSVAYARAKRGLMVLTKMWAEQLAGTGVTVNATHPGWVDTPGVRDSLPVFHRLTRPLLRSPEQGSDTILWLAASETGGRETGRLWHDRVARSEYRLRSTVETAADRNRLWESLAETTAAYI